MPRVSRDTAGPPKPLRWYRKLAAEKGRLEAGAFAVEGERAVRQVVDGHPEQVIEIVAAVEPPAAYRAFPVRAVTESQYKYITSAVTPQGLMAVVRIPEGVYSNRLPDAPGPRVLLLEDVQDPGNVGTLVRTAAAFDYSGVVLSERCADPLSPKCVQASAGSVLALWLRRTPEYMDLVHALERAGYSVIAADLRGEEDPCVLSGVERLALALGNEAAGMSPELLDAADHVVRVPIARARAESLNVAVCGGICMYLSSAGKRRKSG